jgi:hypothetical protein
MASGRPHSFKSFSCPNCQALYQIVKVEAGPESVSDEVPCRVCGAPLAGREGKFVLKYFLLREATRVWRSVSDKQLKRDSHGKNERLQNGELRRSGDRRKRGGLLPSIGRVPRGGRQRSGARLQNDALLPKGE